MKPLKILVVCQHYWPESFQVTEVCEELVRRGHDVTALVGVPNYPSGKVPREYRHGRNRTQEINGVHIIRAAEIARGASPVRLAINYYSYANDATRIARELPDDFDIVYVYQLSPVMMANPALEYKRLHGTPMLLYCCDLWPESMKVILHDHFKGLLKRYERISKEIYTAADLLVVQSPAFPAYFEQVHGMNANEIRYLPQFANGEFLDLEGTVEHEGTVLSVLGNIGRAQDVDVLLHAIAKMRHREGLRVDFVGSGPRMSASQKLAERLGIADAVRFLGAYPTQDMARFYRSSDACVLALNGSTWIGTTLPSRLQGYMAAGKTVLAAINGGAAAVIKASGCGRAVPAGDVDALSELFDEFVTNRAAFADCGERGREYFKKIFMRAQHLDALEAMFGELVGEE